MFKIIYLASGKGDVFKKTFLSELNSVRKPFILSMNRLMTALIIAQALLPINTETPKEQICEVLVDASAKILKT